MALAKSRQARLARMQNKKKNRTEVHDTIPRAQKWIFTTKDLGNFFAKKKKEITKRSRT